MGKLGNQPGTSWIDDLSKSWINLVIVFIFSACFVGGGNYLLFHAAKEKNQIERKISEMFEIPADDSRVFELTQLFNKGWFSDQQNLGRLNVAIKLIGDNKYASKLDTADATVKWCIQAINQLNGERGKISGYDFSDSLYKTDQAKLLQAYDSTLNVLRETIATFGDWEKESPEKRNQHLDAIIPEMMKASEAFAAGMTISNQLTKQIDDKCEMLL